MAIGTCFLCQKELQLLSKSHIIPDFFYRGGQLFNENHQFHKLLVSKFIKDRKSKLVSIGIYDSDLLCSTCDNSLLASLEKYGKSFFFDATRGEDFSIETCSDGLGQFRLYYKVDYRNLKLLLLSVLWRASISRNDFFKEVVLSVEVNERLRRMLIDGDPGLESEFPIILMRLESSEIVTDNSVSPPMISTSNEGTIITFLVTGYIIQYHISYSELRYLNILPGIVKANDKLFMPIIDGERATKFFFDFHNVIFKYD